MIRNYTLAQDKQTHASTEPCSTYSSAVPVPALAAQEKPLSAASALPSAALRWGKRGTEGSFLLLSKCPPLLSFGMPSLQGLDLDQEQGYPRH